jgi:hypothetical protein
MNENLDRESLLSEAAEHLRRAAELTSAGDVGQAELAQRRAAALTRAAKRLDGRHNANENPVRPFVHKQSDRDAAAEALTELDAISSPRIISEYAAARFGKDLSPSAFSSIRRDERRAWNAGVRSSNSDRMTRYRPAFVVPALDGGRFLPARGQLALSSWETWRRLVGPRTPRVEHLRTILAVLKQWQWLEKADGDMSTSRFGRLVDQLVRNVPGATQGLHVGEPERIRAAVELELEQLLDDDKAWRMNAAERAERQLNEDELHWGWGGLRVIEGSQAR